MICPRCQGTGQNYFQWDYGNGAHLSDVRPCTLCQGSGRVRHLKRVYRQRRMCATCHGTGRVKADPKTTTWLHLKKPIEIPCPTCRGQGWYMPVSEPEFVAYFVPETKKTDEG